MPQSNLAIRTYLQVYTCNNTKAQALTRFPVGSSLRVLGNCLDVPSQHFVAGQRIWTYSCNGTKAQTWTFGTNGTIRPTAATSPVSGCVGDDQSAHRSCWQPATAAASRSGPGNEPIIPEIGRWPVMRESTANTHVTNICKKLGVDNTATKLF